MEERAAVCPGIKAGQKNCHNKKEVLSNVGQKDIKKDQAPKRPQKVSGQALKICGMTLICLGVMFAVAWVNRNRQENRLAEEYTISAENPRHIRFEEQVCFSAITPWLSMRNAAAFFQRIRQSL